MGINQSFWTKRTEKFQSNVKHVNLLSFLLFAVDSIALLLYRCITLYFNMVGETILYTNLSVIYFRVL